MGFLNDLRSLTFRLFINNRPDSNSSKPFHQPVPESDSRDTITRVLTGFGKFAVDSACNDALKVKEGLKDHSPVDSANLNSKPRHTLMMEEMQARMVKMEEDLHIIRLDDEDSILCAKDLDPRKDEPAESNETSAPAKTDVKKVFIRSRL
uniref:uncharacterized protein LOC122578757 isoform X2 n=1 Tax=Erigeron canadensis TaxID=72917 RepID=UPI001CB8D8B5|nr:uncharacterized protein LOC122578757 isoform X2 [Erigeron canadensis]